jgi:RNA polymerase-associated protein RTF1
VTSIVARRKALNNPDGQSLQQRIAEGSRLRQEYNTARARGDKVEANRLRLELDAYTARHGPAGNVVNSGSDTEAVARLASGLGKTGIAGSGLANEGGGNTSVLEEISKRNRQLNHEDARRIQVAEAERRKKAQMERIREAEAAKKR